MDPDWVDVFSDWILGIFQPAMLVFQRVPVFFSVEKKIPPLGDADGSEATGSLSGTNFKRLFSWKKKHTKHLFWSCLETLFFCLMVFIYDFQFIEILVVVVMMMMMMMMMMKMTMIIIIRMKMIIPIRAKDITSLSRPKYTPNPTGFSPCSHIFLFPVRPIQNWTPMRAEETCSYHALDIQLGHPETSHSHMMFTMIRSFGKKTQVGWFPPGVSKCLWNHHLDVEYLMLSI